MKPVKPIYIKLLIIAIVAWVISTTFCIAELYLKVGCMEHSLIHKH